MLWDFAHGRDNRYSPTTRDCCPPAESPFDGTCAPRQKCLALQCCPMPVYHTPWAGRSSRSRRASRWVPKSTTGCASARRTMPGRCWMTLVSLRPTKRDNKLEGGLLLGPFCPPSLLDSCTCVRSAGCARSEPSAPPPCCPAALVCAAGEVQERLRRAGVKGRTVTLKLKRKKPVRPWLARCTSTCHTGGHAPLPT